MTRLSLPAVFGVPVRTSWSWMIVAFCLTAITYFQLAPLAGSGGKILSWTAGAALLAVGCVASLIAHDYAHIRIARRTGSTVDAIEPSLLGALPDTCYVPETPARDVKIALVGPLFSLLIATVLASVWLALGFPRSMPGFAVALLAAVNGGLFLLGLLPGYPFDGGRLFRAFIWFLTGDLVSATRMAAVYGQVLLLIALLGGVALLSLGETYAVWGTWVLVLCWTLNRARGEGLAQIVWRETGKTLRIDDLFQAGVNRVPASSTIDESIESLLDNFRRGPTLIVDGPEVIGLAELKAIRRIPRANWTQTTVGEVMTGIDSLPRLDSSAPVTQLLAELPGGSQNVVLVQRDGKIIAAADRDFVLDRVESYMRADRLNRRRRR